MKRNTNKKLSLSAIVYMPVALVAVLFAVYSCSSSNNLGGTDFSHKSQFEKMSREAITKPLFMQSKRANIELPVEEDRFERIRQVRDSVARAESMAALLTNAYFDVEPQDSATLADTENVAIQDVFEDIDLSADQNLSEVLISTNARYTPEREGRAKLDFFVKVPKELLSSRWRVVLYPELITPNGVTPLEGIVLTGREFESRQIIDKSNYESFLNSLVDAADYDEVYLDRKRISKDIRSRQNFYWNEYNKEWKRQVAYEKWKFEHEDQDAFDEAQKIGYDTKNYHANALTALEKVAQAHIEGKDTTGLYNQYLSELSNKGKKKKSKGKFKSSEMQANNVPKKYRDIFMSGRKVDDIENYALTERDSTNISNHRYLYDEIAYNEVTKARKEEIYKELVKFPIIKRSDLRVDTTSLPGQDFVYEYKLDYPVTDDVKDVRLAMTGRVEAVDRSSYTMAKADTLTYYVSTLSQLADWSLGTKETKIYRNVFSLLTITPTYKPNSAVLEVEFADNKQEINKIVDAYYDFTVTKGFVMDSVILKASSSLEGTYDKNLDLSRRRSVSMKEYLKLIMPSSANVERTFQASYMGEDWGTMITEVEKRTDLKNQAEIVEMLEKSVFPDQTEDDIKLKYRSDYNIIYEQVYPKLRKIDIIFNMSRTMGSVDSVYVEPIEGYTEGLELLKNRNYEAAYKALSERPDYNTALALTCLGEYEKAYNLLVKESGKANASYLLAIVSYHMGRDSEGVEHLLAACEMDPSKVYRIPLDTETKELVEKYDLYDRINEIVKTARLQIDKEELDEDGNVKKKYNVGDEDKVGRELNL